MKKIFLVLSIFCVLIGVSACQSKKELEEDLKVFKQGDVVIEDGIIYTFYTREYLINEVIPYVEEEDDKPYYNFYYYDMSESNNLPVIPTSFEGDLIHSVEFDGEVVSGAPLPSRKIHFYPEMLYDFLMYCEPNYSPTSAYFYRLRDYFESALVEGFIVSGYTENLARDVVIPSTLHGFPVRQIGFKAFAYAPMETLTFLSSDNYTYGSCNILHPYAFYKCMNLKSLKTDAKALSMSVADCPRLSDIQYIGLVMDCSLYHLPSLTSVKDCDARPFFNADSMLDRHLSFHNTSGIRKSVIYDCDKLYTITGYPLSIDKGVIYYNNLYPYYVLPMIGVELTLKDEFFTDLSWNSYNCFTYNPETMELYLPFLNIGVEFSVTIKLDASCKKIVEEEDGYYISIAYPKIIKGAKYFSSLYEEPVYLKLISK